MKQSIRQVGQGYQLSKIFVENFPIPKIDEEKQKPFIELVDKILALKKEQKDTKELEDKIDEMVYKLYDLNEDEIETIKRQK